VPSSKNYKRNYTQERKTETKQRKHARVMRNQARQEMIDKGKASVGDGKDVGHKTAISKGGKNKTSNLMVQNASANRSFKRKSDGSMASETSKKERTRGRK
jgi:hypothetical protein